MKKCSAEMVCIGKSVVFVVVIFFNIAEKKAKTEYLKKMFMNSLQYLELVMIYRTLLEFILVTNSKARL